MREVSFVLFLEYQDFSFCRKKTPSFVTRWVNVTQCGMGKKRVVLQDKREPLSLGEL